ncbi:cadherin-related tumor suppressor, partial [Trichomycterus rosablanca]|uniref:cadherin-related tumor suppressor n=1 Tax=Trichomycterus rosablanca TaxID=2290929 RepID=UPI002F354045
LLLLLLLLLLFGQFSYSIPEEMQKGSLVGNIAQDLGMDLKRLKSGKARVYSGDSTDYIELNKERGVLLIKEKIDRESICVKKTPCALHIQMILENPMELYTISVEITDINDNPPLFPTEEIRFEISESAATGARFLLERAMDADVGTNDLHGYSLQPTDHFVLQSQNQAEDDKKIELILQRPLDRETQERFTLLLTAVDGGEPVLSGLVKIHVTVLDANDNAPVFTQSNYKTTLEENANKGTKLITVSASDADTGLNGRVSYFMSKTVDNLSNMFTVDQHKGDVVLNGLVDFEKASHYQIEIQAKDQGGLSDSCKVTIDVLDVNDNTPSINILSMTNSLSEKSKTGTIVAMMNVKDPDSDANGHVHCSINNNIPFTITSPSNNVFSLYTEHNLDRERESEYNIIVTCFDEGVPSLSSSASLRLHISDVNDNAPVFEKNYYESYVVENNTPGLSIFTVKARDADSNQNARVSYILEDSAVNGVPVSSYVSVSADSGVINAVRSFDYEQLKYFHFRVKAQDGGSPPLSSNVTVKIIIQDQNDNAPQVLYPVQTSGSPVTEIVPRSADVGYLVTKVVAVDVDSGQNAWLSYKLMKSADRALFEVGPQNGEIRTVRQVTDKDAVKQKLTVVVEDNGQPSRSAVVTINVAVADNFPEALSEFKDFTHGKEYNYDLTFYLVLALAAVSFLFITTVVVIISLRICRWRQSRTFYQSNLPVIPYYSSDYADTGVTGTLPHMYNYDVCMTTDSRKSNCKYSTLGGQSVLVVDRSFTETMKGAIKENSLLVDSSSPELVSYSIAEEMVKGSIVGNIAQDLGLDVKSLKSRKARIYMGGGVEYIELSKERGLLLIKEKIDREALCSKTTSCALHPQLILENPMELYKITVDINDVNDNAPFFRRNEITFEISEFAAPGVKFTLENAADLDVGLNGLLSYSLKPTEYFALQLQSQTDTNKNIEMILQKPLDRENQNQMSLTLTATDGGEPPMSGTVQIHVSVLDVNDNAPVFDHKNYKATVTENSPKGFELITVRAFDNDEGPNGLISYDISNVIDLNDAFVINPKSGQLYVHGSIDYERANHYQLNIQARDQGGLSDSCVVVVEVIDVNDNKPVIDILSMSNTISENSKSGTVIAMLNVNDPDSGSNGHVHCSITEQIPFTIISPSSIFFSLITAQELDREKDIEYNITVTCSDEGVPTLFSSASFNLHITDVNDNAPVFEKNNYEAYVVENNTPGVSIFTVKANDADSNQNARVSYILEDGFVNGIPVASYVSVSADSGVISSVRSFDYEQLKDFNFRVKAQDGGSPPLNSNVTVKVIIQDQNDNVPQVLYPVQTSGSPVAEIVPRSAEVGYLVTKVVAVDVDSGQNAWLAYKLQKSTDRTLFEVGPQNGEIRTVRQVTDKDAVKQKLTVVVEDNGQPSRSAVVNINVAIADSFPEVLTEFTEFGNDNDYNENMTFYLILALAAVSMLFIFSVIAIISVKIFRWRQNRLFYKCAANLPVIPYYPPSYADGTLQHVYNYEMCGTTDSRMSDMKFVRPYSQDTLGSVRHKGTVQREKSAQEDNDLLSEVKYTCTEMLCKSNKCNLTILVHEQRI